MVHKWVFREDLKVSRVQIWCAKAGGSIAASLQTRPALVLGTSSSGWLAQVTQVPWVECEADQHDFGVPEHSKNKNSKNKNENKM